MAKRALWLLVFIGLSACSPLEPYDGGLAVEPGCNPLASTRECLFPFPSRFFEIDDATSVTGRRWNIADSALTTPDGLTPIRMDRYDLADGASPVVPILVYLGVDVDPAQLVGQHDIGSSLALDAPIGLFDLDTGARVPVVTEMDQNQRLDEFEGRHALIIRPMVPMQLAHRHGVAIRSSLRDAGGAPIATPPGFAALRDRKPTRHQGLEAARPSYDELFAFLDAHDFARQDLLLAWDFMVASEDHVLGPILSMREQTYADLDRGGHRYTITKVTTDPNPDTALLVEGDFDVPCFLDETNTITRDADGQVIRHGHCSYPFTMIVPAVAREHGGLRLTLFGHGIFGSGRSYFEGDIGTNTLMPLAQRGESVLVATDWIGLSENDQDLIASEVITDFNRINVVTDRLQQSLINNLTLIDLTVKALQYDPRVAIAPDKLLADDEVGYYGVSLGGIQGGSLTSLSRDVRRSVLAVPGGAWSTMLPRSVVYTALKPLVDAKFPDPLVQLTFVSLLQGMFDFPIRSTSRSSPSKPRCPMRRPNARSSCRKRWVIARFPTSSPAWWRADSACVS